MKVKYSRSRHNAKQTSFTSQTGARRQCGEQELAQYYTNHDVTSGWSCRRPENVSILSSIFIQRKELDSSGLFVNEEKPHWVPMQVGEWLGFVINTISMTFRIPEKKVCKLKRLLNSFIQNKSSSYRELARITSSIISVALAVGPISRLLSRQMYLAIESRSAWDHIFLFATTLLEELKFWFVTLNLLMVTPFGPPWHPLFYFPTRAMQLSEAFLPPWTACGQRYVHNWRFGSKLYFSPTESYLLCLAFFCWAPQAQEG